VLPSGAPSRLIGVGSNGDEPVTEVRGAEGCRWKTVPLDIEPERGQVPENLSPDGSISDSKEVRHVLHDDESGSKLANGSAHLAPQNGLGIVEAVALACGARSLARDAAGDDGNSLGAISSNCSHIVEDPDPRPSSTEKLAAERVDLAEPPVLEPGKSESEIEQAAATEERSDIHVSSLRSS
jgi:hypothetical protein